MKTWNNDDNENSNKKQDSYTFKNFLEDFAGGLCLILIILSILIVMLTSN